MGCVPGSKREKRFLRLTGLSPRGFLGLTAAAPLRVVVSPPLAAMSIYAAFGSENRTTALADEGKQANRPAGVGNAPLLVLTHHFPRRGKSALRSALGIISTSMQGTKRGAFPRAEGAVVRFSIPRSGIIKLIAQRAIPQPSAQRAVKPENPPAHRAGQVSELSPLDPRFHIICGEAATTTLGPVGPIKPKNPPAHGAGQS